MYSSRFTGIGRYTHELVEHLLKIDTHNEYVLFFNSPEFEKFHTPPTLSATATKIPRVKKVLVNAPHYSIAEQTKFLHLLNHEKLDLMHFTHFNAPIFYHRPSIVTVHDLTLSFFPGKKMTSPLYRLGYQWTLKSAVHHARKIIAVSKNTSHDLQKLFHIDPQKIAVIYEGVNENFKPLHMSAANVAGIKTVSPTGLSGRSCEAPHMSEVNMANSNKTSLPGHKSIFADHPLVAAVRQKYRLPSSYLLYTGVWRSHKNLPNLIEAFSVLVNEYGWDGSLVITGREDPVYAPEILQTTASLKLENNVIFTGLVDEEDLVPLYNGSLAYVFPSLYEGFGLPPLEAMQCGVPVVASNTSCIPEVCGKDNALFFDPHDPCDMAAKIFEVISRKSLRQQLIANGLKHVQTFSWEKMAKATLDIYNAAHV